MQFKTYFTSKPAKKYKGYEVKLESKNYLQSQTFIHIKSEHLTEHDRTVVVQSGSCWVGL